MFGRKYQSISIDADGGWSGATGVYADFEERYETDSVVIGDSNG